MSSPDETVRTLTSFSAGEPRYSIVNGFLTACVDVHFTSEEHERPQVITNNNERSGNLLSVIKSQLSTCKSFDFCVAFVAESGLQPLVEILADLKKRGVRGRFLTSTYLNFNSPDVYAKLLEYDNIETRVYQGNLHTKSYLFDRGKTSTVIVGSSNLTQGALTCNREWNVLFHSLDGGAMLEDMHAEFEALWTSPLTASLSPSWIESYAAYNSGAHAPAKRRDAFCSNDDARGTSSASTLRGIRPNTMQVHALEALDAIHRRNDPRALLISATGTGKTYLSAFDVLATKPRRVLFLAHRKRILEASRKSYRKLLGTSLSCELYSPERTPADNTCLFAMCSTIVKHLNEFDPRYFDYIVIDEAHRTGSASYQRIMAHFTPRFCLGMTATPERTDGYDVFSLFNHVIAYKITLQDALGNDMLAPFHYFGIADLSIDDRSVDDPSLFSRLTSAERVKHIAAKIEEYSVKKRHRRGLIFCNRNDEAASLSEQFNALGYRTLAISGSTSDDERNRAIERLESGELEYLFSVDILNEGVDIPSVDQIIMLRRTESAIVFVQQLGRGLRKCDGKDYALVLDFIGNYQKNFFVPVALSGDKTYNKDRLRRIVQEGSSCIPGASTVSFDRIAESRIYRAIDNGNFSAAAFLKSEYTDLRNQLGHIPTLIEFDENGSIDPMLIIKKYGSYHAFLNAYEKAYQVSFTKEQEGILKYVSQHLGAGKRPEDLLLLQKLLESSPESRIDLSAETRFSKTASCSLEALSSAARVLSGAFSPSQGFVTMLEADGAGYRCSTALARALNDQEFARQLRELIDFGLARYRSSFTQSYRGTRLVLNQKYTYEEVCRLLNWQTNVNGQNIGGYKYDEPTNTYPVFINYDKAPDISDTIKYEDRFVSERELIAVSKKKRYLNSPEIERLKAWPGNGMKIYLFMRKNTEDGTKEFYFLGEMEPTGAFKAITTVGGEPAVEITYRLVDPVRQDIYRFMLSDLSVSEEPSPA